MAQAPARQLLSPLDSMIGELQTQVASATGGITAAADVLDLLPRLLGEGTHHFLLLFQNNAEVRATGGMFGSVAILRARNGKLKMIRQGSAGDVGAGTRVQAASSPAERKLFGPAFGADLRDVNFTPDFPRAAQMAAALIEHNWGTKVDAVLAVDPVAMAHVLQGAPPVTLSNGALLTSQNAVAALLNQIYLAVPDPAQQDDLFEEAAKGVFDAFVGGAGDTLTMFRGLAQAAAQGRVRVWSTDPEIADAVRDSRVSGELTRAGGDEPQVGIYLNDGGSWKMGYYLRIDSSAQSVRCTADGRQQLRVTSTIRNTASPEVRDFPVWVAGDGSYVAKGSLVTELRLYAPPGATITGVNVGDQFAGVADQVHDGREVSVLGLTLKPGQSVTIEARIEGAKGQRGDVTLSGTPDIETLANPVSFPSSCA